MLVIIHGKKEPCNHMEVDSERYAFLADRFKVDRMGNSWLASITMILYIGNSLGNVVRGIYGSSIPVTV